jgi:hypothetical protein
MSSHDALTSENHYFRNCLLQIFHVYGVAEEVSFCSFCDSFTILLRTFCKEKTKVFFSFFFEHHYTYNNEAEVLPVEAVALVRPFLY